MTEVDGQFPTKKRWGNAQIEARKLRISKLEYELWQLLWPFPGPPQCQFPDCHCGGSTEDLTVGHVDGCTWKKRGLNLEARLKRYIAEFKSGIRLRVECRSANSADGAMRFQGKFRLAEKETEALRDYLFGPLWIWEKE